MEKQKKEKIHRKYDAGFKAEAVKLVQNGRSIADVSSSLGIGENLLYKWRATSLESTTIVDQQIITEMEYMRRKLKQVEQERDILKKALDIFSQKT